MYRESRFRVFPYILITVGVIFLLDNMGIVDGALSKLWPFLLIVPGVVMIARSFFE